MKFLHNFLIILATFLFISSSYAIELTEVLFPENSFITIKAVNDMNVTINPSGNSYSYDLTLQGPLTAKQFRQVFKINQAIVYNNARQKIFGSINGNFTYNPNETNGKNVEQGYLSAYRNGSFATTYFNSYSTNTNKIYKINGTTNKYLIGVYYSIRDNTFFGIDSYGNFTYGIPQDDPNAQFEIEIYSTEQDAINSIKSELAAAQQAAAQQEAELAAQQAAEQQAAELAAQQAAAQQAANLSAQQTTSTQLPQRSSRGTTQTTLGSSRTRTRSQQISTTPRQNITTAQVRTPQIQAPTSTQTIPETQVKTPIETINTTAQTTTPTNITKTRSSTYTPPVISRQQVTSQPRVYQRPSGRKLSPANARQYGIGF